MKITLLRRHVINQKLNFLSEGFFSASNLSPAEKRRIFSKIISKIIEERKELQDLIVSEVKLTQKDANNEIKRSIETFSIALNNVDYIKEYKLQGEHREIIEKRRARGPLLVITPFSSPLSSPAHKIACGLIAGTSILFKPSRYARNTGEALYRIIHSATGGKYINFFIEESEEELKYIIEDDKIGIISFTGSYDTGKKIIQLGGVKKYHMELSGGNSSIIFTPDFHNYSEEILDKLIDSILTKNGQRCNSLKHIFLPQKQSNFVSMMQSKLLKVKENIKDDFQKSRLFLLGSLINEGYAINAAKKIKKVLSIGQKYTPLISIERMNSFIYPAIYLIDSLNRKKISKILEYDIPGPIAFIYYYKNTSEFRQIVRIFQNDYIRSGLQLSFYTTTPDSIKEITNNLLWGGIIINDIPTYRNSFMPFGGFGKAGLGKEGFFETIIAFTDPQVIVYNL